MLPQQFAPLESLLQRMTIRQPDGSKGLLALGLLGETVKRELADGKMAKQVEKAIESNDQVRRSSSRIAFKSLTLLTRCDRFSSAHSSEITVSSLRRIFSSPSISPSELLAPT